MNGQILKSSLPSTGAALLILATNFFFRLSTLLQTVVNIDEPQFAQFAMNMIRGFPPYTTMIGEKPFFTYLYYYVILSTFGHFNLLAVHAATILWVGLTAIVVYMIIRQFADRTTALAGALIYSVFTTMGELKLISTSSETLMNLPVCISVLFFIIAVRTRKPSAFLLTGLFIGIASQFRYQAGIQLAVCGTYLTLYEPFFTKITTNRTKAVLNGIRDTSLILLTFLISCGFVLLYLWGVGSWDDFILWTLKFEFDYIKSGMETINIWEKGFIRTCLMILGGFIVWFAAAETVFKSFSKRFKGPSEWRDIVVFNILWFLWGFAAVCVGARFAGRYYIQIFPPIVLLAIMSLPKDWFTRKKISSNLGSFKKWAFIVPAISFFVIRFFSAPIYERMGELDYARFQEAIGAYINSHTTREDLIYVWGWGNGIYIYAERYPATRFITADFLTGRIPGSPTAYDMSFDTGFNIFPGSWEMFMSDLERDKPSYIVDTSPADIHDYKKYPIHKYPALKQYIDRNYVLETRLYDVDLYRRRSD